MVAVQSVLDLARQAALDVFLNNATIIQVGDDNTTPTAGDTSIGNLIDSGTIESTDTSVAGQITYTVKFGITDFIGETIREATLYDGANILSRDLTIESLKGADQIFWITITVKANAVNA